MFLFRTHDSNQETLRFSLILSSLQGQLQDTVGINCYDHFVQKLQFTSRQLLVTQCTTVTIQKVIGFFCKNALKHYFVFYESEKRHASSICLTNTKMFMKRLNK